MYGTSITPQPSSFQRPQVQPDITQQVFGWNPYAGRDPAKVQPLPEWASANHEIEQLTDLYQQQLAELVAAHNLLLNDQENLASMLAPFIGANGMFIEPPDEMFLLMKKGLDFRLQEFEEDCRRLQKTERKLQRKIDHCTLAYETSMVEAKGYADTKLVEQINEQQRLIEYQQHELDELRFQRDLYSDELSRLRQLCRFGEFKAGGRLPVKHETPLPTPRTLHREYSGAQPPFGWMREIRHGKKSTAVEEKERRHKTRGRPVAEIPPDRPFVSPSAPLRERKVPSRAEPKVAREMEGEGPATPTGGGFLGMFGDVFGTSKPSGEVTSSDTKKQTSVAFLGEGRRSAAPSHVVSPGRRESGDEKMKETKMRKEEEERQKEKEEQELEQGEVVDLRVLSSKSSEEHEIRPAFVPLHPPKLSPLRKPSGFGLTVGSRAPSITSVSSRRSVSRVVSSPRPTTLSGFGHEPLAKEQASKFF